MSHFLTFVTNANGVVADPSMPGEIQTLMSKAFGFGEAFVYSHGWWNDATEALNTYNRFSVGFANRLREMGVGPGAGALSVGIHWPSMISEDRGILDLVQAATFFTMEKRADDVGETGVYALLLAMLQNKSGKLLLNLLGHSFGCKVICAALERLAEACKDGAYQKLIDGVSFNVVLLQAAFDHDDFEDGQLYAAVAGLPNLRVLVTTSGLDKALSDLFKKAHTLEFFNKNVEKLAMGFAGPSDGTVKKFGGCEKIELTPGMDFKGVDLKQRLVCADLTKVHENGDQSEWQGFSGHHSDIYREEIYGLIGGFLMG